MSFKANPHMPSGLQLMRSPCPHHCSFLSTGAPRNDVQNQRSEKDKESSLAAGGYTCKRWRNYISTGRCLTQVPQMMMLPLYVNVKSLFSLCAQSPFYFYAELFFLPDRSSFSLPRIKKQTRDRPLRHGSRARATHDVSTTTTTTRRRRDPTLAFSVAGTKAQYYLVLELLKINILYLK